MSKARTVHVYSHMYHDILRHCTNCKPWKIWMNTCIDPFLIVTDLHSTARLVVTYSLSWGSTEICGPASLNVCNMWLSQGDGNLCMYTTDEARRLLWASNTVNGNVTHAELQVRAGNGSGFTDLLTWLYYIFQDFQESRFPVLCREIPKRLERARLDPMHS